MTNPVGRPSKYDPAYCDAVVELGRIGKSFAQMASHFDVARSTIDKWAEDHPEFSEALSRAKAHSQAYWETMGHDKIETSGFNAQVWKKTMEARFRDDYTERKEVSGPEGGPVPIQVLTAVPRDTD